MSDDLILSLNNFSLSYEAKYYRAHNVRDLFVAMIKNPVNYFLSAPDRLLVLDKISFDVKKGERVGILGANGVGKTSLCRYLSKIIHSDKIVLNGEARAIFETGLNIYPELTGRENATLISELMYDNISRQEKNEIIEEALQFSDLKTFSDVPLKNYSKGMKARLFLSLLTARPSDLIILDEVLGGTDQFFAEKLNSRIGKMIRDSGAAVIVSHNLDEIEVLCNRVIVLSDRSVAFDGSVSEGVAFYRNMLHGA